MAKNPTSTSSASKPAAQHAGAAKKASALAAKMVSRNPNIEAFKRIILKNKTVQKSLASAKSEDDFISKAVSLAEKQGVPFTERQARNHLKTTQELQPAHAALAAEVDQPSSGGGGGGGSSAGCSSSGTVSNPSYSIQCGLSTQKCLCTI